jgi:hypothetical protein
MTAGETTDKTVDEIANVGRLQQTQPHANTYTYP